MANLSAVLEIRKLVQGARDRGDVVDISAFARRLKRSHPDCKLHDLTEAISAAISDIGGTATWDTEPSMLRMLRPATKD